MVLLYGPVTGDISLGSRVKLHHLSLSIGYVFKGAFSSLCWERGGPSLIGYSFMGALYIICNMGSTLLGM